MSDTTQMILWIVLGLVVLVIVWLFASATRRRRIEDQQRADAAALRSRVEERLPEIHDAEDRAFRSQRSRTHAPRQRTRPPKQHDWSAMPRSTGRGRSGCSGTRILEREADRLDPDVRTDDEGYRVDRSGRRLDQPQESHEKTEPENTEPDMTQLGKIEPRARSPRTQPETTQPDNTQPDNTQPDNTQPERTEPEERGAFDAGWGARIGRRRRLLGGIRHGGRSGRSNWRPQPADEDDEPDLADAENPSRHRKSRSRCRSRAPRYCPSKVAGGPGRRRRRWPNRRGSNCLRRRISACRCPGCRLGERAVEDVDAAQGVSRRRDRGGGLDQRPDRGGGDVVGRGWSARHRGRCCGRRLSGYRCSEHERVARGRGNGEDDADWVNSPVEDVDQDEIDASAAEEAEAADWINGPPDDEQLRDRAGARSDVAPADATSPEQVSVPALDDTDDVLVGGGTPGDDPGDHRGQPWSTDLTAEAGGHRLRERRIQGPLPQRDTGKNQAKRPTSSRAPVQSSIRRQRPSSTTPRGPMRATTNPPGRQTHRNLRIHRGLRVHRGCGRRRSRSDGRSGPGPRRQPPAANPWRSGRSSLTAATSPSTLSPFEPSGSEVPPLDEPEAIDEREAGEPAAAAPEAAEPEAAEQPTATDVAARERRISGFEEVRDGGYGMGSAAPRGRGAAARPRDQGVSGVEHVLAARRPRLRRRGARRVVLQRGSRAPGRPGSPPASKAGLR